MKRTEYCAECYSEFTPIGKHNYCAECVDEMEAEKQKKNKRAKEDPEEWEEVESPYKDYRR